MIKNSEYDQEIPQSQDADKPMAPEEEPHHNQETPRRQTKQSNKLCIYTCISQSQLQQTAICIFCYSIRGI